MQIVIDIPKYVYDTIVASDGYIADCDNEKVGMAVKNGTVLPKHGRLIDADALKDEWKEGFHKKIVDALMDDAPTILEAWGNEE